MNNRQFIAKQRVKYIWKTLKYNRSAETNFRDTQDTSELSFWEYEQTPRTTSRTT